MAAVAATITATAAIPYRMPRRTTLTPQRRSPRRQYKSTSIRSRRRSSPLIRTTWSIATARPTFRRQHHRRAVMTRQLLRPPWSRVSTVMVRMQIKQPSGRPVRVGQRQSNRSSGNGPSTRKATKTSCELSKPFGSAALASARPLVCTASTTEPCG